MSHLFTIIEEVVIWVSKLLMIMNLSTIGAYYMVAIQACKEAIWIKRLIKELGNK